MNTSHRPALRRTALCIALMSVTAPAFADDAREAALEKRIGQLEQQLAELKAMMTAPKAAAAPATDKAGAAAPGVKTPVQVTTIIPGAGNPNTTLKVGGFIKADFMETRTNGGQLADSASGRDLYVPGQTPVGGHNSRTDFDGTAKFSRVNVGIDTVTDDNHKLGAFFEWDFFGGALGNENSTNTYGATVRHAYVYWDKWLAGQTWSNFMDTAALPDTVDFIGPTDGLIFVRQPQIRYTDGGFSASLEDPQTVIVPYHGGAAVSSDRGSLPDLTLRYGWKGAWGSFGVGTVLRNLRVDRNAAGTAPAVRDSTWSGAVTAGGKWVMGANDDLRYQLTVGSALGRYIGLTVTGDAVQEANGDLEDIGGHAGYVAWRHAFSKQLRSNLMFARSDYDNDVDLTGTGVTKNVQSFRLNLIYSPLPKLDVGAEYMRGTRELESGADGDIDRLQFMVKYSF